MAKPTATDTAAATSPADKQRNNFAKQVEDVRAYAKMKIEVINEVAGSNPSEQNKGQILELTAILAKLGGAK